MLETQQEGLKKNKTQITLETCKLAYSVYKYLGLACFTTQPAFNQAMPKKVFNPHKLVFLNL